MNIFALSRVAAAAGFLLNIPNFSTAIYHERFQEFFPLPLPPCRTFFPLYLFNNEKSREYRLQYAAAAVAEHLHVNGAVTNFAIRAVHCGGGGDDKRMLREPTLIGGASKFYNESAKLLLTTFLSVFLLAIDDFFFTQLVNQDFTRQ